MKTEDLSEHLWAFVHCKGYKIHFVPKKLVAPLLQDLSSREHEGAEEDAGEIVDVVGVDNGWCDRPGMIMTDRPIEHIKIDTFQLDIPSQDFEYFTQKLFSAKERTFPSGEKYYKIHGWLHCIIFTPEQKDLVLKTMEEILPDVRLRAHLAEEEFDRRLREINGIGVPKIISRKNLKFNKKNSRNDLN